MVSITDDWKFEELLGRISGVEDVHILSALDAAMECDADQVGECHVFRLHADVTYARAKEAFTVLVRDDSRSAVSRFDAWRLILSAEAACSREIDTNPTMAYLRHSGCVGAVR